LFYQKKFPEISFTSTLKMSLIVQQLIDVYFVFDNNS